MAARTFLCRSVQAFPALVAFAGSLEAQSSPLLRELHQLVPVDEVIPLIGDLDGDGDADIPFSAPLGAIDVLFNDGDARFTTSAVASAGYGADDELLADVDGDGDLDLLFASRGSLFEPDCYPGSHSLRLNDGSGHFADAPLAQLPHGNESRTDLELGDIDGDGDVDLLVAGYGLDCKSGHYAAFDRLLVNDGTGWFQSAPVAFSGTEAYTSGVAWADIDRDGDLDVLIAADAQPRLWRNDGSFAFVDVSAQLPSNSWIRDAVFGDVDSDGDLDAIAWTYSLLVLWLNDGSGSFSLASGQIPSPGAVIHDAALIDLDGDGDLDLIQGDGSRDHLFVNDASGSFSDASATHMPLPRSATSRLAFGDLDGDGDVDGIFRHPLGAEPLRFNDGTGRMLAAPTGGLEYAPGHERDWQIADLNADDALDIAAITDAGTLHVLRGDGHGSFSVDTTAFPTVSGYPVELELGDFDRDGDLDAFVGSWSAYTGSAGIDRLFLNLGDATFADASVNLPSIVDASRAAVAGDVDGDGDLDLLLGNTGPTRLYLGDGHGFFTDESSQVSLAGPGARLVALADVDGDGDLDAYLGHALDGLQINDGVGSFSPSPTPMPAPHSTALHAEFADVDGDGDLDLIVGTALAPSINLFLNDGAGAFSDATSQILASFAYGVARVQLCDFDDDDDLDILASAVFQRVLLLNDGHGFFANGVVAIAGDRVPMWALDIDQDDDVDAIDSKGRVLTNTLRQVAWRQFPRPGRQLDLDVYGPANGHFILLGAREPVSAVHTPFGELGVLRTSVFRVDTGALDATGHASVRIDVPDNPLLIGRDYFWQALVGRPARLTNVERAVFSGL